MALALAGIGALHAAWGSGLTTWPGADLRSLARKVVGGSTFPSAAACYVVAALLGTASGLVAMRSRVTDPRTLLLAYLGTKTVGLACPENTLSRGGDGKTQWVRNPCRAACEYKPFRSTLGVRHSCSPDPRRTQRPESNGWRWVFLPEAVIIETTEGRLQPVLCYISPTRNNHPADLEYLGNLIAVATEYGFPHWYIERLASVGNRR